jgi:hypothetical protein
MVMQRAVVIAAQELVQVDVEEAIARDNRRSESPAHDASREQ